jgi:hypothetical protein
MNIMKQGLQPTTFTPDFHYNKRNEGFFTVLFLANLGGLKLHKFNVMYLPKK